MRHYHKKDKLPHDLYMQMLYLIRSYPELIKRREELLHSSPRPPDGQPRGSGTSDPTADKAVVLARIDEQIQAVEDAVRHMRARYGQAFDAYGAFMSYPVFCRYRSSPERDMAPCKKTWYRYRTDFEYMVAKKLNCI